MTTRSRRRQSANRQPSSRPPRPWEYGVPSGEHPRHHWEYWNEPYEGLGGLGWYEGLAEALHRGEGPHAGKGPRNYQRTDDRIEEDINERLTRNAMIDATDVEVTVRDGEVTLRGQVNTRQAKWVAEAIAESVFGVKEITNQIKVRKPVECERKAG